MMRFSELAKLGRALRQDDLEQLGEATTDQLGRAIDTGDLATAKSLAAYVVPEGKSLHDLFCDWLCVLFTQIADAHGEEEMHRIMRASQATLILLRSW